MRFIFVVALLLAVNSATFADEVAPTIAAAKDVKVDEEVPKFLYKVLSEEDWKESQKTKVMRLPDHDKDFIHLAKYDQLPRILSKYWADAPEFVVLKLDTAKLQGKLVLEVSSSGVHKYYHLYNGNIPMDAVVDVKVFKSSQSVIPQD